MDNEKKYMFRNLLRMMIAVAVITVLTITLNVAQNQISRSHQYTESMNTLRDISNMMDNNAATAEAFKETYHSSNIQILSGLKKLMVADSPTHVFNDERDEGKSRLASLSGESFISYLFLIDSKGDVILSVNNVDKGKDLRDTGFFTDEELRILLTCPQEGLLCSPDNEKNYYFYATPLRFHLRECYLVIGSEADVFLKRFESLNSLDTMLSDANLRDGESIFVLDTKEGVVTYCSDETLAHSGDKLVDTDLPTVLPDGENSATFKIGGEEYYCVFFPHSETCTLLETVSTAVRYSDNYKPTLWAIVLFTMTVMTAICFILNVPKNQNPKKKMKIMHLFHTRLVISLAQVKRVLPFVAWGLVMIFCSVFYCRTILKLSWAMNDVERPLTQLDSQLTEIAQEKGLVKDYCSQMYVAKAKIIAGMLEIDPSCLNEATTKVHTEYSTSGIKENLKDDEGNPMTSVANSAELLNQCDSNEFQSIQIFNEQGYCIASSNNVWYFQLSLNPEDQSYAFRSVLDGKKDSLVQDEQTDDDGFVNQYVGVVFHYYTTKDSNGDTVYVSRLDYEDDQKGLWSGNPITAHTSLLECCLNPNLTVNMMQSMNIGYIMEHISLSNSAYMVVFDSSDDHNVLYTPNKENMGKTAAELNVSDAEFSSSFNGFQTVNGAKYFECCRYNNGYYVAIATPLAKLYATRLPVTCLITGSCIIAMMLILAMFLIVPEDEFESRKNPHVYCGKLPYLARWSNKTAEQKSRAILEFFLVVIGIYFVVGLVSGNLFFADSSVIQYVFSDKWERGFNIFAFTKSAVVLVAVLVAVNLLEWFVRANSTVFNSDVNTIVNLILSFIRYGAVIAAIFYCIYLFGLQPMSLLASAGILTVVLGLGAQSLIGDFLAGIFLVFENSFHVGDMIVIDGNWGIVQEIGIRTTKIRDLDNFIQIYNNNTIKNIINTSVQDTRIRAALSISYDESIERVEQILAEELPHLREKIPELICDPFVDNVQELSESSVDLRINADCKGNDRLVVIRKLKRELKLICERRGINIPYNHLTVTFENDKNPNKAN